MDLEKAWEDKVINFIALAELGQYIKVPNGRIIRIIPEEWDGVDEKAA